MIKKLLSKIVNLLRDFHKMQNDSSALMTHFFEFDNMSDNSFRQSPFVLNKTFKTLIKEATYLLPTHFFSEEKSLLKSNN
jgi:hypothetical protein